MPNLLVWAFYLVKSWEKATFLYENIWVRSATKNKKYIYIWPINGSNLHILDGRHQYAAIHLISLTRHYNIVSNGSISIFFGMANSLLILVLCFKVKIMHWFKAISHFKPAEVGQGDQSRSLKLFCTILVHKVSPRPMHPHSMIN